MEVVPVVFFDYFYTKYFLQQAGDVRKKYGLGIVMQALFITAVLALAIAEGYLYEVFMLFVVPTRIAHSCLSRCSCTFHTCHFTQLRYKTNTRQPIYVQDGRDY